MARKDKYMPDFNLTEVVEAARMYEKETGYRCALVLRLEAGPYNQPFAEAHLYDAKRPLALPGVVHTRGPLPSTRVSSIFANCMRLVLDAYAEIERNPWLWTDGKRAEARGEGAAPVAE